MNKPTAEKDGKTMDYPMMTDREGWNRKWATRARKRSTLYLVATCIFGFPFVMISWIAQEVEVCMDELTRRG